jgi:hypothetical protein
LLKEPEPLERGRTISVSRRGIEAGCLRRIEAGRPRRIEAGQLGHIVVVVIQARLKS